MLGLTAMNTPAHPNQDLPTWLRWLSSLLGVGLSIGSLVMLYCPPEKASRELDGKGTVIKVLLESTDVTTPFLSIFLAGVALVVFGINGIRFAKITAAGVSAEAPDATAAATNYYKAPSEDRPQTEVQVAEKESPDPTDVPAGYLEAEDGGKYAVYKLNEVPSSVITDALASWPTEDSKPEDLSGFEFATRKTGKGNHPWTLKFKGKKAVIVSYGGFAKPGATVSHPE